MTAAAITSAETARRTMKLVVWDLDNTLWSGTLAEGDEVRLREDALATLRTLDSRGILHSIASRNDHADAIAKLREFSLEQYFLYPQINWDSKAESIRRIAADFNIGLDSICFIDDQPFEREEVQFTLPQVCTVDAAEAGELVRRPEFTPRFITEDSARRREMYQADIQRKETEDGWAGTQEEFLAGLNMKFAISAAREADLQRAEELTLRTNQLNSTGYTYSYEELDRFRTSRDHTLLVAELEDRFGTYGKIGLALIERRTGVWTLKLLLMSCRVMSRGAGTILLYHVMRQAQQAGVKLRAEFKSTDRNRMMLIAYKFANFREVERDGAFRLFEHDLQVIPAVPGYVNVETVY